MKKVYEETGKYLYDISKIVLGVAVITAICVSAVSFIVGAYFLHKDYLYQSYSIVFHLLVNL